MTKKLWLILLVALVFASDASAAVVKSVSSREGKVVVYLTGEIGPGDADQVTTVIRAANQAGKFVTGIRLNSLGGNLTEGIKLADIVRGAKIATVVPNNATCASACFIAFAAGTEKYASNSASVGVHGASENGAETSGSSAATIAMARIVKELGVPAAVIGKMVVTPPSEVVWLTPNDLRAMGTTMTGKPAQTAQGPASNVPVPQQTPSNSGIQANTAPTWRSVIDKAAVLSARQNGGTPRFGRVCQPEFRICTIALYFKTDAGVSMMMRTTEDVSGQIKSRDVCNFNSFGDVRNCVDWDTGVKHTDMKDAQGTWNDVSAK